MSDRISSMGDDILRHILSFLDTKEALSTSILSKRWKDVWATVRVLNYDNSIPVFDIDDEGNHIFPEPSFGFQRLIYATLLGRAVQHPITTFRLRYELLHTSDELILGANADINHWVKTAMDRGLENLDLGLLVNFQEFDLYLIRVHSPILSCKSLVHLKLQGVYLSVFSSVDLPNLKSLHLEKVKMTEPHQFLNLLCGCPNLEDLNATFIEYAEEEDITPFTGWIENLPKLARAYLGDMGLVYMNFEDGNVLLKAICNVESVTLHMDHQCRINVDPYNADFPKLNHLDLYIPFIRSSWLLYFLNNSPMLQTFKFQGFFVDGLVPRVVPECLISLTECHLRCYTGVGSDLSFAKFVLLHSRNLQSLKILRVPPYPVEEVVELLRLSPKICESCEISSV